MTIARRGRGPAIPKVFNVTTRNLVTGETFVTAQTEKTLLAVLKSLNAKNRKSAVTKFIHWVE